MEILLHLPTMIHSMPCNPSIIKFVRYAKLSENAGYGIDKMIKWEQLTGGKVEFDTTLVSSTITYWFGKRLSEQASDHVNNTDIQQNNGNGATESEQAGEQVSEQVNSTDIHRNDRKGRTESEQVGGIVRGTARGTANGTAKA